MDAGHSSVESQGWREVVCGKKDLWDGKAYLELFTVLKNVSMSEDRRVGAGKEYVAVTMRETQNSVCIWKDSIKSS